MDRVDFTVCEYAPDKHRNLILDTWKRSYRYNKLVRMLGAEGDDYYRFQQAMIEALLDCSVTKMAEVKLGGGQSVCIGYAVASDGCLHYIYVKHAYRRMGVANAILGLFDGLDHCSAYLDKPWQSAWLIGRNKLVYNQYRALNPLAERITHAQRNQSA